MPRTFDDIERDAKYITEKRCVSVVTAHEVALNLLAILPLVRAADKMREELLEAACVYDADGMPNCAAEARALVAAYDAAKGGVG